MNSIVTRKILFSVVGLLISCVYTLIYFQHYTPSYFDIQVLGGFALLQLIFVYVSWYNLTQSLLNSYIIFITAFYTFNISQPIIEFLGISIEYRRLIYNYIAEKSYYDAAYYSMLFLQFFHIGALVSVGKKRGGLLYSSQSKIQAKSMYKVLSITTLLSIPFYLYHVISQYIISTTLGYAALYQMEYASSSRLVTLLGDFFPPSVLGLFCVSLYLRKHVKVVLAVIVTFIFFPPLLIGGRSNAVIIAAIVLLIYSAYKKINIKKAALIGTLAFSLLYVINIVGKFRLSESKDFDSFIEMADDLKDDNNVLSTIQEMGWSMFPLAKTIEAIPEYKDYDYGESIFWNIFAIVPNMGFWDKHPSQVHDAQKWLNKFVQIDYGIGYSMIAEVYNNFGPFGFIFIFFIGYIYGTIFSKSSKENAYGDIFVFYMSIIFLWFSIKGVRNQSQSLFRALIYYMFPLYLLIKYTYKRLLYKYNKSNCLSKNNDF